MSRDLRKYATQTNRRLLIGFFLIVFLIGLGLIYVFFDWGGAVTGLLCLLAALLPAALAWLVLGGLGWLLKKIDDREG